MLIGSIWKTCCFYWLCAKEAARGTVEKANAWFWLVGVPIVALIAGYWGGELHIPDQPQGFITFMVVTVAVTWVIFFIFRFVGAPARLFFQTQRDAESLRDELRKTADRVANSITLTATVESDIVDNSGDLEWWLVVCSSCPVHLQYGKISISSTLDDGVTTNHTGSGNTLTMGQSLTYKFPFKERYKSRKGILRVDATLDYGLIDYPPCRRLTQKMRVAFQPRGAVTFADCHTEARQEIGI